MEGKRKRKSVESFQASTATPAKKKRLSISDGQGKKLSDLHLDFGNRQSDELRPLYKLLFNTPGQVCSISPPFSLSFIVCVPVCVLLIDRFPQPSPRTEEEYQTQHWRLLWFHV